MAEWTNIFDLAEWDIYIQYIGITSSPDPDSVTYLVKAEDLDPAIGTVIVDGGLIICDLQPFASSGGTAPSVVVIPRTPLVGLARLTCSDITDLLGGVDSSAFAECVGITQEGDDTYSSTEDKNNSVDYASTSEWSSPAELPSPITEGSGMTFTRVGLVS